MVVGKSLSESQRGKSAFVACPLKFPGGRSLAFCRPTCKSPFPRRWVLHSKRARHVTIPSCCETLPHEDETDVQVIEHDGTIWDVEIDEDELVDIEPDSSFPKLNVATLVGRLGADPVFKIISTGSELCTFSIAVSHEYDPIDTDEHKTSWFDVEVWGTLAKLAAKARKGVRVGVSGSLGVKFWTGRDGLERQDPFIRADTFEILQSRSEQTPYSSDEEKFTRREKSDSSPPSESYFSISGNLRDLPF